MAVFLSKNIVSRYMSPILPFLWKLSVYIFF